MRAIYILSLAIMMGLILTACEKDNYILTDDEMVVLRTPDDPKMVPFKGHFEVISIDDETTTCFNETFPEDDSNVLSRFNTVEGNATHLGKIDPDMSAFTIEQCTVNLTDFTMTLNDVVLIRNKKGDGLEFEGTSVVDLTTNLGLGNYTIVQGYGKFENATGSMTTYGNLNNDPPTFTADGMVTQPNH